MQINWIEYNSDVTGQSIKRMHFKKINLLVGISGAGKTQILSIITDYLSVICHGMQVLIPSEFKINFTVDNSYDEKNKVNIIKKTYTWYIKTNSVGQVFSDSNLHITTYDNSNTIIELEELYCDDELILKRTAREVKIKGYNNLPMISYDKSAIYQFKTDALFVNIIDNIIFSHMLTSQFRAYELLTTETYKQYHELVASSIKNDTPVYMYSIISNVGVKLELIKKYYPSAYSNFLFKLQDIFPEIEDFEMRYDDMSSKYVMYVNFHDVGLIHQRNVSQGILKSIYVLSCVVLGVDNALVMLDELENSLGINCLNEIAESIACNESSGMQFFITSHHPYIINNISQDNWIVVSQHNGEIVGKSAEEIGIVSSKQDSFFQLINYMERQLP